jgi:uncharacterized protein (DUF849 family)
MVFDNPVSKVQAMLDVMAETHTHPEFECFDVGIVRSVGMYLKAGLWPALGAAHRPPEGALPGPGAARRPGGVPEYNFVMGVASGMPCDIDLLGLLPRWLAPGAVWQATLIGRGEIWPVHQRVAELGGMLRTGLEDSFYLPGGARASGNGVMIEALAQCARHAGRSVATPDEARQLLGLVAA